MRPIFFSGGGAPSRSIAARAQQAERIRHVYRLAAGYVNRILRGEKPGDLPVQAPTKYELVVNLKTAKLLGLTLSPSLTARADKVIE